MEERKAVARRFGALVTELARANRDFDVSPNAGGRSKLAKELGMHVSMVSRALDGEVLPQMWQFTTWARVLRVPLRNLMVEAGVISAEDWPEDGVPVVRSVTSSTPPEPEAVADAYEITDPLIRRGLVADIEKAQAMQAEVNERRGPNGGAVARG
jgi:hypothetical protein